MFDDFFYRALLVGVGVAIIAGPLGCFVIWRRLSYFGDTLSHAALLGVALAFLVEINFTISVFIVSSIVALFLIYLRAKTSLPSDALLGLLAHSVLALGIVVLGFMTWVRIDLLSLLFGDILAVSMYDIWLVFLGGALVLVILVAIWRPLFADTVSNDLATAEGMNPQRARVIFTLLLALVISISIKVVGVLLITGLLIIPAATARNIASGPVQMAIISTVVGIIAVVCGLFSSLKWDTSSGPTIIAAALVLFVITLLPLRRVIALLTDYSNKRVNRGVE
ncbi:MAG: metal ABC transporter permease [Alphaproteobacteria bacterium]|nr:metal ABC transporter permease [Alphaproteobacteria bacterium]